MPALLSEQRPQQREEVEAQLAEALDHEGGEDDCEDADGKERGEGSQ